MWVTTLSFWLAAAVTPEDRAIAYLAQEVPRWRKENGCFSCHNNGDAARALYAVRRHDALAETTAFLTRPDEWDRGPGDPVFSDKRLARIQFASALAAAIDSGAVQDRGILVAAAKSLADVQDSTGAWRIEGGDVLGTPATWGTPLATAMTRRVLERAGAARFRIQIDRASRWLASLRTARVVEAAAVVLANPELEALRRNVDVILRAENSGGGWGPYSGSPAEAFDTALALLALATQPGTEAARDRGRRFLIRMQLAPGGWTETTRPSGGSSYAQHISTSGWATLALLATRSR